MADAIRWDRLMNMIVVRMRIINVLVSRCPKSLYNIKAGRSRVNTNKIRNIMTGLELCVLGGNGHNSECHFFHASVRHGDGDGRVVFGNLY